MAETHRRAWCEESAWAHVPPRDEKQGRTRTRTGEESHRVVDEFTGITAVLGTTMRGRTPTRHALEG